MAILKRKRRWCGHCNHWFRGKWKTCCNACFKIKRDENTVCVDCNSPDCEKPYLPLKRRGREYKKQKRFKMNPDWDFRGSTIRDMEDDIPKQIENPTDYWYE